MLVLARQSGEALMIGDNIEITVLDIQNGKVKIGIKAPKEITVLRKELLEEAKNENEQAASPNIDISALGEYINKSQK
jgi:carbon storage regulator